jgi:hypothetical protein
LIDAHQLLARKVLTCTKAEDTYFSRRQIEIGVSPFGRGGTR